MSKPTDTDIVNGVGFLIENGATIDEFEDYLNDLDPADFRKYWGTVDVPKLIKALPIPYLKETVQWVKEEQASEDAPHALEDAFSALLDAAQSVLAQKEA